MRRCVVCCPEYSVRTVRNSFIGWTNPAAIGIASCVDTPFSSANPVLHSTGRAIGPHRRFSAERRFDSSQRDHP